MIGVPPQWLTDDVMALAAELAASSCDEAERRDAAKLMEAARAGSPALLNRLRFLGKNGGYDVRDEHGDPDTARRMRIATRIAYLIDNLGALREGTPLSRRHGVGYADAERGPLREVKVWFHAGQWEQIKGRGGSQYLRRLVDADMADVPEGDAAPE